MTHPLKGRPRLPIAQPTPRQLDVLLYVAQYLYRHCFPPTVREICGHFGWSSENAAQTHLNALQDLGLTQRRGPGLYGLRLTPQGKRALLEAAETGKEAAHGRV